MKLINTRVVLGITAIAAAASGGVSAMEGCAMEAAAGFGMRVMNRVQEDVM